eukprot:175426-Pleurochrysis_carterae.AAC.1
MLILCSPVRDGWSSGVCRKWQSSWSGSLAAAQGWREGRVWGKIEEILASKVYCEEMGSLRRQGQMGSRIGKAHTYED